MRELLVRLRVVAATLAAAALVTASGCASSAPPTRPELPQANAAIASLTTSIPSPAWFGYASGDTSPVQIAAGTMELGTCSEELWSARREPKAPLFPADAQPSDTVAYLATLAETVLDDSSSGVTVPVQGVSAGQAVVVDNVTYHRGVSSASPGVWVADPYQATGPLRLAALFGSGSGTVPLCSQLRGLPLVLGDPVPVSDAAAVGVGSALDAQLAVSDAAAGVTRSVAAYDPAGVEAVFGAANYDLAVGALNLSGEKLGEFLAQSTAPPPEVLGDVRVEFIQRDGVMERIVVRRCSDGTALDVMAFRPHPGWSAPEAPAGAQVIEFSAAG
jgi:hypothetical protein